MQLRRHGIQLLVLLITLTATEPWASDELVSPNPTIAVVSFDKDRERAAVIGLRYLSVLVNDDNAAMLGFINHDEASSAEIGVPLEIYLVSLADLRRFDPASSMVTGETGMLKEMNSFIYPLLTKRPDDEGGKLKTRSGLVVSLRSDKTDKTKRTWIPTNWGLKPLARAITEYRETVSGFKDGFVLWIPALNLHFLGDHLTENLQLIPLATRPAYGLTIGVKVSWKIVLALYAREARALDEDSPG